MKAVKVIIILALIYVGIVATFESLLGYFQPEAQNTMVISTFDESWVGSDRVVARIENEGKLYVAVNHWPRAWYNQVLANPVIDITLDGTRTRYVAVQLDGDEYQKVNKSHELGLMFRFLTGFPPRKLMRLDAK